MLCFPPALPSLWQVDRATAAAAGAAVAQNRLADKVAGILSRVERELDDADTKIGDKLRVLDMDNDGIVSVGGRAGAVLGGGGGMAWQGRESSLLPAERGLAIVFVEHFTRTSS